MKPVVNYIAGYSYIPGVGGRAVVFPLNHPDAENVSNTRAALTSEIVWYNSDTGEFETKNSRYVPVAQPDSSVVQ